MEITIVTASMVVGFLFILLGRLVMDKNPKQTIRGFWRGALLLQVVGPAIAVWLYMAEGVTFQRTIWLVVYVNATPTYMLLVDFILQQLGIGKTCDDKQKDS